MASRMTETNAQSAGAAAAAAGARDVLDTAAAGPAAIRGGLLRVTGYFAGVVLSVGSAALLFRHLGVEDTGRYVTVLSLVTLAGGITDAGLQTIGVREFSTRPPAERERLLRSLLGVRIALTAAGVAIAVVFAAIAGYGATLVLGTLLAGLGLLAQMVQSALGVGLMSQLRLGWVAFFDFLKQLITVVLIVTLVVLGASLLPFLAISIPAGAIVLLATGWVVRGTLPLRPAFDVHAWRALLRDALPFAAATAVAALYFRLAIIIVSLIATATQTGYFGASFRVVEVLIVVPQLLVGAAFPIFSRAARDDRARLAYALGRTLNACLALGVGVALLLFVGAPFVIEVIASDRFAPAADVLRVQGLALAASFVSAVWGYGLLSLHRHRAVLVVSLAGLCTGGVLVTVLTAADGARGAAVATAVAEFVLALASWIALRRTGLRLDADLGAAVRVLAAAAIGLAPLALPLPDAARLALAAALYALALVAFRALPRELLDEGARRLRRRGLA